MISKGQIQAFPIFLLLISDKLWQLEAANKGLYRFMNFTDISSKFNEKYIGNFTSWAENGSINMEIKTVQALSYGLRVNIPMQLKLDNSKRNYQTIFTLDYDVCRTLQDVLKASLLRDWFRAVLRHSNLMENCPIEASTYHIRGFKLESETIPVYMMPGQYRMNVYAYYGKLRAKTAEMVVLLTIDMRIY